MCRRGLTHTRKSLAAANDILIPDRGSIANSHWIRQLFVPFKSSRESHGFHEFICAGHARIETHSTISPSLPACWRLHAPPSFGSTFIEFAESVKSAAIFLMSLTPGLNRYGNCLYDPVGERSANNASKIAGSAAIVVSQHPVNSRKTLV